jgi:TPP-dependent indolepyruvate ferredoxin oxidoreductase alpha subunit
MAEHKYQSKTRSQEMHALLTSKNFETKVLCRVPDEHGVEFEELVLQMEKPVLNKIHISCPFADTNTQKKRVETMRSNASFGRSHTNNTPEEKTAARVRAQTNLANINANTKYAEARRKGIVVGGTPYSTLAEASKATGFAPSTISNAANGIRPLPNKAVCRYIKEIT